MSKRLRLAVDTSARKKQRILPSPDPPEVIEADGDLHLIVDSEQKELQVSSQILTRSSEVFKKMLSGPWIESKPIGKKWNVSLPDDNYTAVKLIMNIIHVKFDGVPEMLPIRDLFQICVLVHKYDLLKYLRPWAESWCEKSTSDQPAYAGRLWIGWVLGNTKVFMNAADQLARTSPRSKDGELIIDGGSIQVESIGVLDDIVVARNVALHSALSRLVKLCNTLMNSKLCLQDRKIVDADQCNAYHLGAFLKNLNAQSIFPIPLAADCNHSVAQVVAAIKHIEDIKPPIGHQSCHERYLDQNWENHFKNRSYFILKPEHVAHMTAQAQKLGLREG